jgi:predicted MPP superfamily phosphohydrolase
MVEVRGAKFWMGGVTDPAAVQTGLGAAPDTNLALTGGENADLKILLSHRPHLVADAARSGFHLQLSGHTHGGQFFPWTYVVRFAHTYFLGLMRHEQTWIYVSPGTGSWGPPLRLGTTPELTKLHLVRAIETDGR